MELGLLSFHLISHLSREWIHFVPEMDPFCPENGSICSGNGSFLFRNGSISVPKIDLFCPEMDSFCPGNGSISVRKTYPFCPGNGILVVPKMNPFNSIRNWFHLKLNGSISVPEMEFPVFQGLKWNIPFSRPPLHPVQKAVSVSRTENVKQRPYRKRKAAERSRRLPRFRSAHLLA